jgi:hypothetical protein
MKVLWKTSAVDEPVLLYSELDDQGWERRKVEQYRDGSYGYSDATAIVRSMGLSLEPLPSLAEIAAQPEFEATEIAAQEFEHTWLKAQAANG